MKTLTSAECAPWTPGQVRLFVKMIRTSLGDGWRFMTDETRAAYVDSFCLGVICGQDKKTVEVEAISRLRQALLKQFGLGDDDVE